MSFNSLQIKELEKASNDFVYFTNEIFSKSNKDFIGGQYVDDTARFLSQNNRTIRVSARNHFKSYAFYSFFLYKLMFEGSTSNIEAHYFSFNADLAAYHVGKIKAAIEANPYFEYIIDAKPTAESVLKYTWDREHYVTLKPHGLVQFKRGIHCLGPNEKIIVRSSKTGEIRKIASQNLDRAENTHVFDEVLTEKGFSKITHTFKRKNSEKLFLIELINGARMKITPDHPCVVKRNDKKITIPASEVLKTDFIPYIHIENITTLSNQKSDNDEILWIPIDKIKLSNRIPDYVYDIRVDSDTHLFALANGIITHNCDIVFVDDPFQDPDNELNPASIYKINEVFKSNILDMPHQDGGILHCAGTPQTNSDFFFDKSVTNRFKVRVQPAITTSGEALWPEWMDIEELEEKRIERTDRIFKREYLCLPTYSSKGFFDKEYIESKIVNINLSSLNVSAPYKTDKRVIAGFDIGKKSHPSYLCVFEEREGKLIMIHEKWMDGWNYSNGEEYNASHPTQLEYLKLAIKNFKIQILHYDNTRAEFESFDEQGLLPLQMVPVVFTSKSRQTMSTVFSRVVERAQIEIINNTRTVDQICTVTNDLQAIASKFGHGDSFWGLGLAFLGSDGLLTFADASIGLLRREINVGSSSIFNNGSKIPKNW